LDLKISQSLNTVNDTFRYARNTLMMIKSIHQSTEGNSYEIFRILASSAKQTNPSILAVEWAPKIAEADVATFEQRMSLELGQPYRIFEKDSQGTAVPVTRRADYYPVAYVEPLAGNEKALGYDLNSETERSQAIHAAIETQLPATTNPIKLVQDPNSQYGGLLYFAPPTTGNMLLKRQEAPELFMAVIDLNVLLSPLTLLKDSLGINFVVQSTATSKTLATSLPKNTPIDLADLAKSTTNISKTITIADRSWTFQFYAPRDTSSHSIMNWMILGLPLLLSAGTVSGILLITGNVHRTNALITERTNELSSTRDEALRAGSAKSDFLATMSHEIRTPMNGIIGMTEPLAESDLNAEQRTAVNVIQESGAALLSLLNNILDMSKIEAGKIELPNVPFSPSKLIKAVKGLFAPIARSENTKLDVNIDASVPEVVTGDDLRLRQILINIVSNALKFAAGATVTISMRAVEQPGFVKLLIDVKDTGEGMSPTQVSRIFKKFTQAEAGTTRRHGGSGLGLTIAQNLAALMSGSITVDSELGKGTTFHIKVVVGSHHQPDLQVAKSKDLPIAEASATLDFGDLSILIAEDNKTNQIVIRQFLAKLNVTASFADNGRIAVEMARERNRAVVFMDLHMPELNGQDATREIRGLKDSIQQPWIVALTADAFDGTRQECYDAGMNDFITKPVTRKTIVDALEKYKSNRSILKS
jgi:signal transduction histidine kinase/ActR/RegA family two-component response regulator